MLLALNDQTLSMSPEVDIVRINYHAQSHTHTRTRTVVAPTQRKDKTLVWPDLQDVRTRAFNPEIPQRTRILSCTQDLFPVHALVYKSAIREEMPRDLK